MNYSFDYGALREILGSVVVPFQDTTFFFFVLLSLVRILSKLLQTNLNWKV